MQKAMEEQAAAERARRANVTKAEGEKAAAILQAEGRWEASKLDARAKVVLAEADQIAINKITEAVQTNQLPVMFILGGKYIDTLKNLSTSQNAKIVMLPADLPAAIKGMFETTGK
jgi:regulator of protease activity HflC (stomatin/prohibitin superfamily)